MREIFANRLRERQKQLGITQAKMADMINVAPGTLSAYLKQDKVPTLEKAVEIAKALDVTVGWLCGEDAPRADSLQLNSQSTYADLVQIIESMVSLPLVNEFDVEPTQIKGYSPDGAVWLDGISIEIADPVLSNFYSDYAKIKSVLASEAFGKELLDAWLYKKMAELQKMPLALDLLPF